MDRTADPMGWSDLMERYRPMKGTALMIRPMTETELIRIAQEAEDAYELVEVRRAEYERAKARVESSTKASERANREPMAEWRRGRYEQAKREAQAAEADLWYAAKGVPKQRGAVRWARKITSAKKAAKEQRAREVARRVLGPAATAPMGVTPGGHDHTVLADRPEVPS